MCEKEIKRKRETLCVREQKKEERERLCERETNRETVQERETN